MSPSTPPDPPGPASPAPALGFLRAQPFAHRGLHGAGIVENSLSAFHAAIQAGHGMECDVQASLDGVAFVFHDATLERLTEERGRFAARSADLIDRIVLKDSGEPIPRLSALLRLIGGRAPLLIEIKAPSRNIVPLCRAVKLDLSGYQGPIAIMSFNPMVARWFSRHAPDVARGLVVTEEGKRGWRGRIERALSLWRSRAQFLAYDIRDLPSAFAAAARARGLPILTWTVRNAEQERTGFAHADEIIYERMPGHG